MSHQIKLIISTEWLIGFSRLLVILVALINSFLRYPNTLFVHVCVQALFNEMSKTGDNFLNYCNTSDSI